MKLIKHVFLIVLLMQTLGTSWTFSESFSQRQFQILTLDHSQEGKVSVTGISKVDPVKIRISHNSIIEYRELYIKDQQFQDTIWLLNGPGTYEITFLLHIEEQSYEIGPSYEFEVESDIHTIDTSGMFLNPEKDIESDHPEIQKLAESITAYCSNDVEKARHLYDWVSNNIQYDYEKAAAIQNGRSDFEFGAVTTLEHGKGVCYDLSALFAALARSQNIEAKLVKGYSFNDDFEGYHAWNEVYSQQEERWIKLDVTYATTDVLNQFDPEDFDVYHEKYSEM